MLKPIFWQYYVFDKMSKIAQNLIIHIYVVDKYATDHVGDTAVHTSIKRIQVKGSFIDPATICQTQVHVRYANQPIGRGAKHGGQRHQVVVSTTF